MQTPNNDPRFQINPNLNLEHLGTVINEALFMFGECPDTCRDLLFQANEMIYPNASRPATAAENAVIAAMEPSSLAGSACELDMYDMVIGVKRDSVTGKVTAQVLKGR